MSSGAASEISFLDAIANRRSFHTLTNKLPISDDRVQELVEAAMKHVPSAFDSQTTRLVVLFNAEHERFWDFVLEVLKPHLTTPEKKSSAEGRISGFRAARGTILFFEDDKKVKEYQSKFASYASYFDQWSEQTNAMHQYALWTALEAEGAGCNLQHYNPLVDNKAKEYWNIDMEWSLKSQLVFGGLKEGAREALREKELESRVKGASFIGKA